jgi:hypothetical protein
MSGLRRSARRARIAVIGCTTLALATGMLTGSGPASARPSNPRQEARQRVAAQFGVPESTLRIVEASSTEFSHLRLSVDSFKVLDPASGRMTDISLDPSGRTVDFQQLLAQEQGRETADRGNLDAALADRVASTTAGDRIRVAIAVQTPVYSGPAMPTITARSADRPGVIAAAKSAARDARSAAKAAIRSAVASVVSRLAQAGYRARFDLGAAIVHASLPPAVINQVAAWPDVLGVDEEGRAASAGDVYTVVRPTVGADYLQGLGINGTGKKIAQDEVGGLVNQSNPYLSIVVRDSLASLCYPTAPAFNGHATAVAGMIHFTATGSSILATGSCTGNYPALEDRALGAINWGATVVNHSWGEAPVGGADNQLDGGDRYFDSLMINYNRLQVFAAGNDGQTTGNVGSPGSAYNVLTAGNFDDKSTVSWTGDTMSPSSSFRDPVSSHSDREKPEISAPGTNDVSTTIASPWWGNVGTGTSYAAPVITGIAAMMYQRAPAMVNYPVATKAILMATAIHNVEGAARLSEYDGAGGTWAPYADDVTRGVNGSWAAYNWSCANPDTNLTTMSLVAGKRTRVAIAWNTDPTYPYYTSQPSADYDLKVLGPSATVVVSSGSWDNTYEIVDFTPSVSGTYTIQVHKDRCNVSPRQLAYAWWSSP